MSKINRLSFYNFSPFLVMLHRGSGSSAAEIGEDLRNGVVKINIDRHTVCLLRLAQGILQEE